MRTTPQQPFVWPAKFAFDIVTEFSDFVASFKAYIKKLKGPKQLDLPLRMVFCRKKIVNGVGAYNSSEFLDHWRKLTGHSPAAPISILRDAKVRKMFVTLLHEYLYTRCKGLCNNISKYGFPSGCRPSLWWEDHYLRHQVRTYGSTTAFAYTIKTKYHEFNHLVYTSTAVQDERLISVSPQPMTPNTLNLGPPAYANGSEKELFQEKRAFEYDIDAIPRARVEELLRSQSSSIAAKPDAPAGAEESIFDAIYADKQAWLQRKQEEIRNDPASERKEKEKDTVQRNPPNPKRLNPFRRMKEMNPDTRMQMLLGRFRSHKASNTSALELLAPFDQPVPGQVVQEGLPPNMLPSTLSLPTPWVE